MWSRLSLLTVLSALACVHAQAEDEPLAPDLRVVVTVAGEPVTVAEFEGAVRRNRLAARQAAPDARDAALRELALRDVIDDKVRQALLVRYGFLPDTRYETFLDTLESTNAARREGVRRGDVVYGPVGYTEPSFRAYFYTVAETQLKRVLRGHVLRADSVETDPGPFTSAQELAERRRVDAAYAALVAEQVAAADVVVFGDVYQTAGLPDGSAFGERPAPR